MELLFLVALLVLLHVKFYIIKVEDDETALMRKKQDAIDRLVVPESQYAGMESSSMGNWLSWATTSKIENVG